MARDMTKFAVRTTFPTAGPQSGTTSSTLVFNTTAGPASISTVNTLLNDVKTFFTSIGTYYGPQVSRAANAIESAAYDLDMTDALGNFFGSPITLLMWTMPAPTSTNAIPNEVALVLSLRADYGTDPEHGGTTRPRADDRGRIYIGPLHAADMANVTIPAGMSYAAAESTFVAAVSTAISTLKGSASGHGFDLGVWSRKNQTMKDVIFKSVDNSFDTQRRREVQPPGVHTWVVI